MRESYRLYFDGTPGGSGVVVAMTGHRHRDGRGWELDGVSRLKVSTSYRGLVLLWSRMRLIDMIWKVDPVTMPFEVSSSGLVIQPRWLVKGERKYRLSPRTFAAREWMLDSALNWLDDGESAWMPVR